MEKPLSKQKIEDQSIYYRFVQTEQDLLLNDIYQVGEFDHMPISFLFEKKIDKFKNEVRINIFRSRYFTFPYKHPIDLLYISNPNGEGLYVLFTGTDRIMSSGSLFINIDDRINIELKINDNDELLKGKTCDYLRLWDNEEQTYHSECRSYLHISKEDYLKCCNANHLSIKVCPSDCDSTAYEEDCDDLIPYFQILYNETCDGQMFALNKQEVLDSSASSLKKRSHKETQEFLKRRNDSTKETLLIAIPFIIFFIALIIFMLSI